MTARLGSGGGSGIAEPGVHVTNGALLWNGSAWVNAKIAAANITAASITAAELAASAVGTTQIAASAVTDAKIASGIAINKLTPSGGTDGQVITRVAGAAAWSAPTSGAPSAHAASHLPAGTDAIDFSGKINMSGVEASRPTAASTNAGSIYFATDTLTVWRSDGSTWTLRSWNPDALINGAGALESSPRRSATADGGVFVSGVMTLVAIPLYKGFVVNKISIYTGATGAGTPTHAWGALYDTSLTKLAQSTDQTTTAIPASTQVDFTLTAAQTIAVTGVYYVGVMVAATTVPTVRSPTGFPNIDLSVGLATGQKLLYGTNGSALTATAPAGPLTLTARANGFYAVVS